MAAGGRTSAPCSAEAAVEMLGADDNFDPEMRLVEVMRRTRRLPEAS